MAVLVMAAGLVVGAALSAGAATSSVKSSVPARNTCKYYHDVLGPWVAMKSASDHGLAWTAKGTTPGRFFTLEKYGDHLSQCYKALGGFPNGALELQLAGTSMCVAVENASKQVNAHMALYPCLSKLRELFTPFVRSNIFMFKNVNSGLCIEVNGGPASGHFLIQADCSNFGAWQSWLPSIP